MGSSPCERLVSPLLILTASQAYSGKGHQAEQNIAKVWHILDEVAINQEILTDLFVSAICMSITYRLLPVEELLERTDKAIKIVWIPNLDDLPQLDKLV